MKKLKHIYLISLYLIAVQCTREQAQTPFAPSLDELNRPFGKADVKAFQSPPQVYHPETWFHFIGGNVAAGGITADLEAIAGAGLSGIQFFHGQFGGAWPGVEPQITCLSEAWDEALKHTAEECRRLGLKFSMQNCPGWAMSGGPWIKPENAMRHLVWSRTDVEGGSRKSAALPVPQPSGEDWRDYKDIVVLAFPTPQDDTGEPLKPSSVKSNDDLAWKDFLSGNPEKPFKLPPAPENEPHRIEITFPDAVPVRTIEFSSVQGFEHGWCYEPGITVAAQAVLPDGTIREILNTEMPPSSWQDDRPISLACPDVEGVKTWRLNISNKHPMYIYSLRLLSAARKNNWESEAGWTLRRIVRAGDSPEQAPETFVRTAQIRDLTKSMDAQGNLVWDAPKGKWTVLRI